MNKNTTLLEDPEFQKLLLQRSRWRWTLSGALIGIYLVYAVGSLYYKVAYASPFMDSSIPWGIVIGYLIMAVSIVLSIVYVRVVNRLEVFQVQEKDKAR